MLFQKRLSAGEKVFVKITGRRSSVVTWASSVGPLVRYDSIEKSTRRLSTNLERMKSHLEVCDNDELVNSSFQMEQLRERTRNLEAALQSYQYEINFYVCCKKSDLDPYNPSGEICFEGGIDADVSTPGVLRYSSEKNAKFSLKPCFLDLVEEISEEEYLIQVSNQEKFLQIPRTEAHDVRW